MKLKKVSVLLLVVGLMSALIAGPATAETIQIQMTGLDLEYDGFGIFDAGDALGGLGMPSESDPLTSLSFFKDGTLLGTQTEDVAADVLIDGIGPLAATGDLVDAGGPLALDLLTKDQSANAWGLALNVDDFRVYYPGFEAGLVATGSATSIFAQDLPFGVQLDPGQPIQVVISSNLTSVSYNATGDAITAATAPGTGSVQGELVPEPSTLLSLLMAAVAVCGLVWHRRRRKA